MTHYILSITVSRGPEIHTFHVDCRVDQNEVGFDIMRLIIGRDLKVQAENYGGAANLLDDIILPEEFYVRVLAVFG